MKKRSFTELKKSMTFEELNKFCKKVTEEYAKSEAQFARSYFCEHYNISEQCFYKVLEYAVVTNIVEDYIVTKMLNKAIENQNLHSSGAGARSVAKYARMFNQRCAFIAATIPKEEVMRIATDFANNPDISKQDIATANGISRKVLELVLERAIEENIVDDKIFEAIIERSLSKNNSQDAKDYFLGLKKKREANKKGITLE